MRDIKIRLRTISRAPLAVAAACAGLWSASALAHDAPDPSALALKPSEFVDRPMSCTAITVCDAQAVCAADSSPHAFVFSPVETGIHGEGAYIVTWNDTKFDGFYAPAVGMFMSIPGRESAVQLIGGVVTPTAVLHETGYGANLFSETTILNCEVP